MDIQDIKLEISLEAPPAEASRLMGDLRTQLLDKIPSASATRKPEPGHLDARVLQLVLTHGSVILFFEVLKAWRDKHSGPKGTVKVTDEDLEFSINDERLAKWIISHSPKEGSTDPQ